MPEPSDSGHYEVRFVGHDIVVAADGERPLLDEVLRAGYEIPYGCFTGTCERCAATLRRGAVVGDDGTLVEAGESSSVLACRVRAAADLELEVMRVAPLGDECDPPRRRAGTVASLEEIGTDIRRLVVAFDEPVRYAAGQYLRLHVPGYDVPRAYSIATPPSRADRELEFHIKRVPGGVATDGYVFGGLAPGDPIEWSGPYGHFRYRPDDRPAVFIAGGTGLAPLAAMIDEELAHGSQRPLYLFHGARTADELYDRERWIAEAAAHPRLEYVPVVSDGDWDGERGFVTDAVAARFDRLRGHVAYLCGPPPMIEAAVALLVSRKVRGADIHREEFF